MNVMDAIKKLDELKAKLMSLEIAVNSLEMRNDYSYEVKVIGGIIEDIQKEHDDLVRRLESTSLETLRNN